MNFLLNLIGPKLGLAALIGLVLMGGTLWVQTNRLSAAKTQLAAIKKENAQLAGTLKDYKNAVAERDNLIRTQNAAVDALYEASQRQKERIATLQAEAKRKASTDSQRATDLLALQTPEGDELTQCRAAAGLLRDELIQ
ncbi:MAG: hypothetical protein ACKOXK_03965 [Chakrabartia sp.]